MSRKVAFLLFLVISFILPNCYADRMYLARGDHSRELFPVYHGCLDRAIPAYYYVYTPKEFRPEEQLYILDEGKHYPLEFKPIIREVNRRNLRYSSNEVKDVIVSAYQAVKRYKSAISVYEVAKDVDRYTEDDLGIGLPTLTAAYVRSQSR